MTATERLRELLDERGVEWDYGITGATTTRFDVNGVDLTFTPMRDGLVCSTILTPEQAIAATLGSKDTYTQEDVEGAFVSGYSLGLDMFDSSKPDGEKGWNQNERNMDEEIEELGWVRVDAATLGAGTCTDIGRYCFTCSECGWAANEPHHALGGFWPTYCPNCGRRVVDE